MYRRREFGLLGLSAVAAAAAAVGDAARAADEKSTKHAEHAGTDVVEACAKACSDCQRACDACARHCGDLLKDGHKEHAETLATCLDCADFCAAASRIVSRRGPFAGQICESCADACDHCAKACEKFPQDKHMTACAQECRTCEKACKAMLPHLGHAAG